MSSQQLLAVFVRQEEASDEHRHQCQRRTHGQRVKLLVTDPAGKSYCPGQAREREGDDRDDPDRAHESELRGDAQVAVVGHGRLVDDLVGTPDRTRLQEIVDRSGLELAGADPVPRVVLEHPPADLPGRASPLVRLAPALREDLQPVGCRIGGDHREVAHRGDDDHRQRGERLRSPAAGDEDAQQEGHREGDQPSARHGQEKPIGRKHCRDRAEQPQQRMSAGQPHEHQGEHHACDQEQRQLVGVADGAADPSRGLDLRWAQDPQCRRQNHACHEPRDHCDHVVPRSDRAVDDQEQRGEEREAGEGRQRLLGELGPGRAERHPAQEAEADGRGDRVRRGEVLAASRARGHCREP